MGRRTDMAASKGSPGAGRRIRHAAMIALLAGAALPVVANAQQQVGAPSADSTRGGAASAERNSITLGVTARYDSNVARIGDNAPVNPVQAQGEDIRVGPYLSIDFARNVGRHQIGLQSTLGYDFYVRNSQLDSERISVDPYVSLDLPVCDVLVSGGVNRRQSDLGDLVFFGAIDPATATENRETNVRATGQITCGDTYGLRPTFTAEYREGENSNPLRRFSNFNSTRIQPGVSYAGPALGEISLYAVRTETELPNQVVAPGINSGYVLRGAGVSYRRSIGTRLTFDGSVSYVDLQPRGSAQSQEGLNTAINLTFVAGPRLQLVAFANRAFTSSLNSNASYEINEAYGLTANYAVNDRLRLRAGGSVSPRSYFYDVTPIGPFITSQTQHDIFAGATYNLNRRMSLTFDTGYQNRRADTFDFDYDNYFAAVGLLFRI